MTPVIKRLISIGREGLESGIEVRSSEVRIIIRHGPYSIEFAWIGTGFGEVDSEA